MKCCEIILCNDPVAGCPEGDGCPAEHLCVRHYFLMKKYVRNDAIQSNISDSSVMDKMLGGRPSLSEIKRMQDWWDSFNLDTSIVN